jgi:cytochrome c553
MAVLFCWCGIANSFAADPHLRVLAASCAACHGPDGNSVGGTPVLAGLDRQYFLTQMHAFRQGERPSTVMYRHAKGLTEAEIEQLADYFAGVKRAASSEPLPLGNL